METALDTAGLWSALASDLRVYIRRRVGDNAAADDLLQEIFLRVHDRRDGLREDDRVAPWVFRIARSVVVDHLRAKGRAPAKSDEVEGLAAASLETDDRPAVTTLAAWTAAMIETLDPPYAEAVRLADLEGVSQAEAAARLGLSHSGFKSRVQRGRAKLRTVLDACCAVDLDVRGGVIEIRPRKDCC